MRRWLVLLVLIAWPPAQAAADDEAAPGSEVPPVPDVPSGPAPTAAAPATGTQWYLFGAPFYTPETRAGLGLVAGIHRDLCTGCPPSSVPVETAYTMNGQFSITVAPRLFTDPSFTVGLSLHYANFPDRFYGIGTRAAPTGEAFTPRTYELMVTPELYLVPGRLRVGPKLHLRRDDIVAYEEGGVLPSGSVYGWNGYSAAGVGASVTWDGRDSQFFPRSGTYVEGWFLFYPGRIGNHEDFGRGAIDASWFVPLGGDHILALDASVALTTGTVPFTLLAGLGGVHPLRGYRDGWYRDRFSYGLQAEWRFPIVGRLRGDLFGGVGDVAPTLTGFDVTTVKGAVGGGLRFRLTDDGVHLRLDVATRGDDVDLYMIVLEAF